MGWTALCAYLAIPHHLDVCLGCHQPQLHQLLLKGVVHLDSVGLLPLCLKGQVSGTVEMQSPALCNSVSALWLCNGDVQAIALLEKGSDHLKVVLRQKS